MAADVPIEPCRSCGTPKRIDTWCVAEACPERERPPRPVLRDVPRLPATRELLPPEDAP